MIGFIIWIIGVVLCVKAVLEIMKWPVDGVESVFTTSGEGKTCLKY
mgnify:CR=1 FL=1